MGLGTGRTLNASQTVFQGETMNSNYERVKAWRAENPEKVREQGCRYRILHPETHERARQKHRVLHLDEIRSKDAERARLRRQTPESKELSRIRVARFRAKRQAAQEEIAGRPKPAVCELCGEFHLRVVFDHSHVSGNFRGWLCDSATRL